MSCPMFAYGFAAGSIIPLAIVYLMRPESLTNLLEFFSTSLFMALNWSDGVAERFNLTTDLFSSPVRLSMKIYSCYHIEYWYQTCSWAIYLSLFSSLILFLLNQHLKSSEFSAHDDQQGRRDVGVDIVFSYFCIFLLAMLTIFLRLFIEQYLLGQFKLWTMIYLLWYTVSFAVVWLWNR